MYLVDNDLAQTVQAYEDLTAARTRVAEMERDSANLHVKDLEVRVGVLSDQLRMEVRAHEKAVEALNDAQARIAKLERVAVAFACGCGEGPCDIGNNNGCWHRRAARLVGKK